jgi:hypothetical protein
MKQLLQLRRSIPLKANIKYIRMVWAGDGRKVVVGQIRDAEDNDIMIMPEASLPALLTYANNKQLEIVNAQEILNTIVLTYAFAS